MQTFCRVAALIRAEVREGFRKQSVAERIPAAHAGSCGCRWVALRKVIRVENCAMPERARTNTLGRVGKTAQDIHG